ncbi:UDP-glucose 4-epimerase GalE [Pseudomonas sp. DTU_2021_1001937_2_SI_NGA_ILE_001]|uniref:UDP-glucose 4-epimerase GalE n=1 Tax=Pseudomonas sp. DTU_2021_1001937_2_SI_NGA_ILE_001 TaxID=3077589 RepID=UPI0028FC0F4B|nr:UDP-glucose 4-epimerase GalE [Pseudomonas sp. DTU_2021_1001937_2_SI_NGA_ILE_001]WNW11543.1 UDP-glucose 4-epimerase GalE [Pseudomonas sp. DTU_2021_1001937_2_SI_NGA_ILE_001]
MILVTGGTGYIGAHIAVELLALNHEVLLLDNLSNSSPDVLARIARLSGQAPRFIRADVRHRPVLDNLLRRHRITAVIHCAGLKAVAESVREPLRYFDTNVSGSLTLFQAMADAGVFKLVFSSSATVYGQCEHMPIAESCPTGLPASPYGQSKLMAEQVITSMAAADPRWSVALLRYFNPIGAHASGLLGERPSHTPNNLLPYLLQVASGERAVLRIFGHDYPTPDGTGVRDYVHVADLAAGHCHALRYLQAHDGVHLWNMGTGHGHSVLEVVAAFEQVTGVRIARVFEARRQGDIARCWADPSKAARQLQWRARHGLERMLADAWRWQCNGLADQDRSRQALAE